MTTSRCREVLSKVTAGGKFCRSTSRRHDNLPPAVPFTRPGHVFRGAITHTAGSPPPGTLALEDNLDFLREHLRIEEEQAAGGAP
jgi:hypothetical protein